MRLERIIEAGIGLYLLLPGLEDVATGGTTVAPSAIAGATLLMHAFGVKI